MRIARRLTVVLVAAATVLTALPGVVAEAEVVAAPAVSDDHVVVTPYFDLEAEVLANDGAGDPVGADLQVCRIGAHDGGLDVHIWSHDGWPGDREIRPGSTFLDIGPTELLPEGEYTVEYAACDRHSLSWATLTVEIRHITAERLDGVPAAVRFTNPLGEAVDVLWARPRADDAGGGVRIGPGQSRVVAADHRRIVWAAYSTTEESDLPLDYGVLPMSGAARTAAPVSPQAPASLREDEPDSVAPVTAPDHVTLDYYDSVDVSVLANDSDDNPEDLAICRIDVPATDFAIDALPAPWWTGGPSDGPQYLDVGADDAEAGTYEITYYACDRNQLTPGTLTVTVRRFRLPRVSRVPGRPGVVRFENRGYRTIEVQYFRSGSYSEKHHLFVAPHESGTLHVSYDSMSYFVDTRIGPLTYGTIRHLQ